MRRAAAAAAVLCAAAVLNGAPGKAVIAVRGIEVSGAENIARRDIIGGADIKKSGSNLLVDPVSLEAAASQSYFVKSYSIEKKNSGIQVRVSVSDSLFIAAVRGKDRIRFYEAGTDLELSAKDYVRSGNLPIIYIEESDLREGRLSPEMRKFAAVLRWIRENESSLYGEISEIYCRGGREVLKMKGRRPFFLMNGTRGDFLRMKGAAAFLDRSDGNFSSVDLTREPVLAR